MKKNFVYIVLLLTSITFGQNAEKSGMTFLKIGFGARNIAMGDLGVVTADNSTAGFYNPALLTKDSYDVSFTHTNLMEDVSSEMIGVTFTAFGLPFAIGLNTTSVSDIEVRTKPGEVEATFDANYFYGSLSTALEITDDFSAGVTIKYLYENLFSDEATGLGADFGIYYKGLMSDLDLGASINNVGSMNQLRSEETTLPSSFNVGASYILLGNGSKIESTIAAGYKRFLEAETSHVQVGGEFSYDRIIALRVGYVSGFESKDLSYGIGLKWGSFGFDYTFIPVEYGLGNSNFITITYSF
ncbi:MAG: PorV/PorQ family protein [Bacteroidetes bacterium]|nr:PorV/PorQ family protein [Bacteroidota bacterium]